MRYKKLTQYEQHQTSPFVENLVKEAPPIKKRYEYIGQKGKGAVQTQLVNPETGAVEIDQMFYRVRKVDEEKFVKIFLSRFESLWDLNKPAIRVLGYIVNAVKPDRDTLVFRMKDCMEYTQYSAKNSITTGLAELVEHGIIARTQYPNEFYINPLIIFNGSRITIAEQFVIEKQKQVKEQNTGQYSFFNEEGKATLGSSVKSDMEQRGGMLSHLHGEAE